VKDTSAIPAKTDRRRFQRILFDAPTSIRTAEGQLTSTLIDISLKGILVKRPDNWLPLDAGEVDVIVQLDDGRTQIQMRADLVHTDSERLGFRCRHIDMDSVSHLRRLVELNLKDPDLLERQLYALVHQV